MIRANFGQDFIKDFLNTDLTDKTDICLFINKLDLLNLYILLGKSSDKSDKFNLLTLL